jgi:hypothetical protein
MLEALRLFNLTQVTAYDYFDKLGAFFFMEELSDNHFCFTILVYHNYHKLFLSQWAKIDVESFGIVSTQYLDKPSAEWEIAHPFMGYFFLRK